MNNIQDELMHYGILGMHWGHRKGSTEVKKSARTKTFEKLETSGRKHQKIQEDLYKQTGNEYNKRSAEKWKNEADQNKKSFEDSYAMDKYKARDRKGAKRLIREQKDWDQNFKDNWYLAYNNAVAITNSTFLPELNKKYANVNFLKDDPKVKKIHEAYEKEYYDKWDKVLNASYKEMFGDRPTIPK